MSLKVLIVEDQFIEANNLQIIIERVGYQVIGLARSVEEALAIIEKEQPDLALVDIKLQDSVSGIALAPTLNAINIPFIYISANCNHDVIMQAKGTQPYGFIVKPFREKDLLITLEIAMFRHENSLETAVKKEEQLRLNLLKVIDIKDTLSDKMLAIVKSLQTFISFDYLLTKSIPLSTSANFISYLRIGFDEYQFIGTKEFEIITNHTLTDVTKSKIFNEKSTENIIFVEDNFEKMLLKNPDQKLLADKFNLQSLMVLPLALSDNNIFYLFFYSRKCDAYNSSQIKLLQRLSNPLIAVIENLVKSNQSDDKQNVMLNESRGIKKVNAQEPDFFKQIIGKSHLLLNVFDNISHVAPVDTSVLILGESGTGKERMARCIHELSKRKSQPFVKINCAALPFNLFESELFGHEKGSFTGAIERRVGKFELANKGTIFLDEIGDMPPELQSKLLRVLQEKEIDRIGGRDPIKVDVRVLAATNRELEKEVAAGRFRLDLFYRLNVFPVTLPPLRDRKDDIPLLIDHFISIYSKKANKRIKGISKKGLNEALNYHWPGNIRELENLVERAILLSREEILMRLQIPDNISHQYMIFEESKEFKSIDENERDHILQALEKCRGKVWGANGAAELLGIPPTTLHSKMKKFGIKRSPS
ncbi:MULTISPECIES: sigma 54-interacting transcriptional regulator [Chryseobacterium]|uniref:Transcriptional regulator containing GAF, AAA-type ATPase, and DNA-binding Fis domains n=1 Tax=Chryseobacterium wanjuense TaxID=356305 RepID=A0A1I0R1H1_9FLAO|nr:MULTISPECIES: sigma 54-interacting transcriptional regulator [Chryseobacterium]KYH08256.1 Fis family transcriptional regulator [Chryseobacterium cucumeris]SEW33468.1 Transcriptional regulator containing GAF, AAA-type ATPase, and DNA-binding Fis domains [Chryseobacterium wanjuense]